MKAPTYTGAAAAAARAASAALDEQAELQQELAGINRELERLRERSRDDPTWSWKVPLQIMVLENQRQCLEERLP